MLQQTTVATVTPRFEAWLQRFPDLPTLARAPESDVLHAWQGLGYYRRARHLHRAAQQLAKMPAFPRDAAVLRTLPGCGEYTANAIATFAFDQSVPVVEANIARVLCRLFDIQIPIDTSAGRKQLWQLAIALLPSRGAGRHNSALMDLGALVCVARAPRCHRCPFALHCQGRTSPAIPKKTPRPEIVRREEDHFFVRRRGQILLEQSGDRWRGLWILPRHHVSSAARMAGRRARSLSHGALLYRGEFCFTHHRISLRVFAGTPSPRLQQRWFTHDEVAAIPMPTPHRRALDQLLASAPTTPRPRLMSPARSAAPAPPASRENSVCRR